MECIDEVVTAEDEKDLAHMIKKIVEIYSRNGLTINFDKTEYIPIGLGETIGFEVANDITITARKPVKCGDLLSKHAPMCIVIIKR